SALSFSSLSLAAAAGSSSSTEGSAGLAAFFFFGALPVSAVILFLFSSMLISAPFFFLHSFPELHHALLGGRGDAPAFLHDAYVIGQRPRAVGGGLRFLHDARQQTELVRAQLAAHGGGRDGSA